MTIEAVRDLVMRLTVSTGSLAALGLTLDERVTGTQLDPAIKGEIDHLLGALGARGMLDGVSPAELKPVLAELARAGDGRRYAPDGRARGDDLREFSARDPEDQRNS